MSSGPQSVDLGALRGRFDDLLAGTTLAFEQPSSLLSATHPDEVAAVLAEVDRATQAGHWAFGYVAYEAGAGLDPRRPARPAPEGLPLVQFALCAGPTQASPLAPPSGRARAYSLAPWRRDWIETVYLEDVARVRELIAAGDVYQLNLTVRLRARVSGDLDQLYADLAWAQRGRYGSYLDLGRHVVVSASPELFFEWTDDGLRTRPMKGTAPRGRTTTEDGQRRAELLGSEKERAENLMIVDLLRNDLGRLAEVGSVDVPALLTPERYGTVWQLTSEVTARPAPGAGLVDVFRALFPSGSVTGVPKQRAMELIDGLEPEPRGVYCGAVGVVAPPGQAFRARFNVAIRTVTVDRATGIAEFGTGGGITWGSDARAEHAELLTKAAILADPYEEFALLETMAYRPADGVRNLARHLDRLADSAAYFDFSFDRCAVQATLFARLEDVGRSRVRLTLDRDGRVDVSLAPLPEISHSPVGLVIDPEPVDVGQVWVHHKTTRRSVYTTRAGRHPDADDVVLLNGAGQVTETTIANLAALVDGRWWTPPLTAGCLPGVERGRLVEAGELAERDLWPADLRRAEALAVLSSLRGWRPAVLC